MKKTTKVLLLIFVLVIFSFTGCSRYERNTDSGERIITLLDDVITMAENDETFVVLLGRSSCKDCIELDKVLNPYLENHGVKIYDVDLDNEGTSEEEIQRNRKKINSVFPSFNSTPSIYYIKDGEIIDEMIEETSEEALDNWIIKNKLDAK
jgi:predicted bacteriocin transport accessory protein